MNDAAISPPGVHPRVAEIIAMLAARDEDRRSMAEIGAELGRARLRRLWADFWSVGGPEVARTSDVTVGTGFGPVPVRLYDPDSDRTCPIIYVHGGGFVIGDLDTHDGVARRLAVYSGRPVVSVHYRRAPEYPYPAPVDDCVGVALAVASSTDELGLDGARYGLVGDSAGANQALAACLRLRDQGNVMPDAAALIFGCYDPSQSLPSHATYGSGRYLLSAADVRWFWQQYLGDRLDDPPPYTDMLKADLRGLPPLLLTAAECDPLADETTALAGRLAAAHVPHEVVVWPGMVHGCIGMGRMLNAADAQLADVAVWLARALKQE